MRRDKDMIKTQGGTGGERWRKVNCTDADNIYIFAFGTVHW